MVWLKDGKRIAVDDGDAGKWMLRLERVKVEDSGEYVCRAVNKAGMITFTYEVQIIGISLSVFVIHLGLIRVILLNS